MNLIKAEQSVNRKYWEQNAQAYQEDCLKIQDEHGNLIPFVDNDHQKKVDAAIEEQRQAKLPVRIIVLKERKAGTSTKGVARVYHGVRFHPADAVILAHDVDSTKYIFNIANRFYENLPDGERLPTESSNREELKFARRPDGSEGGSILVKTAGTKTSGRSLTPLYLLASESAFYSDADTVMLAMLNSIPDTPESMVIIESTANGMGGWFYDQYWAAKLGNSAYKAIFLCWKDLPKHSLAIRDPRQFEASLTSYERQIQSRHGLTLEQLNWRRWAIENKCNKSPDFFKQEYPLSDTEAFLSSGRARFDRDAIRAWPIQEPLHGYLQNTETYGGSTLGFVPNLDGYISLWRRPQNGRQYVIGADVAKGIEIDGAPSGDKYDYSVADVIDANTAEQVAQIRGQFDPDEFGRQLNLLGRWYSWAYLGVESNDHGATVLNELVHCGYPEDRIFTRTHAPDGGRYSTPQKGWLETVVTRHNLIDGLAQSIRRSDLIIHSQQTQNECLRFVINPNGKAEAQPGSKDDCVFSLGIAREMITAAPDSTAKQDEEAPPTPAPRSYRPSRYAPSANQAS